MKTPPPPPDADRRFGYAPDSFVLLVGAFLVFLLFRPYQGIIHDARLYVGYAMAAMDPDGIGRDIVFVNDGQSKFSVYPLLMRSLAEWIGPSRAAMVMTYGGLTVWFAAFAALVRRLLDERFSDVQVLAVIVLAASLPSFYGGQGVFRFAEFYATPRVFAEAAVMFAFWAVLESRFAVAALSFSTGLVVHPLMTAPGVCMVIWGNVSARKQRALMFAVGAAVTGLLVGTALTESSFNKPLVQFDEEWLAVLNAKHALVFLRHWRLGDWVRVLVHLTTVLLALPLIARSAQRAVSSAITVVASSIVVTYACADVAANVLLTQLQVWRGLWIVAVFATVSLGVIIHSCWSRTESGSGAIEAPVKSRSLQQASSLMLLLAWSMMEINSSALLFVLLAIGFRVLPRLAPAVGVPPVGLWALGALTALLIICVVGAQSWVTLTTAWASPDRVMHSSWSNVVATGLPMLTCLVWSLGVFHAAPSTGLSLTTTRQKVVVLLLMFAVAKKLDSRSTYDRYIERELDQRAAGVRSSLQAIDSGAVLWPFADLEPWALAGSPAWGSIPQGISIVFDRELALRWSRRRARLAAAGLLDAGQTGPATLARLDRHVDAAAIRSLCAPSDAASTILLPLSILALDTKELAHAVLYRTHETRLLHPDSIAGSWKPIESYVVVRCR